MKVQVRVLVTSKQVIRNQTFEIEFSGLLTVAELLRMLPLEEEERHQIFQRKDREVVLRPGLAILINGENVTFRNGLQTLIADGDRISIVHALGGG